MAGSVKANKFNVKQIVYALVDTDDGTNYKYKAIKKLAEPMQVAFQPSSASGQFWGAGVITDTVTKLTGGALQVDANKVPIENRAEILGHTYTTGVLTEKTGDSAPYIAVGYEIEETGSNRELVWLYKCKAKPFGEDVQQTTDNVAFGKDTISISVMPRDLDGAIRAYGDTANSTFTTAMANTFLSTVPGGTLAT